jgi:LAS superfamily LD-carboxypeptidase LdcB
MKPPNFLDSEIISSILKKVGRPKKIKDLKIISYSRLYEFLNQEEIKLIKKFLTLHPGNYGLKGSYLGVTKIPRDIVSLKNQKYKYRGKIKTIDEEFLPKKTYLAYKKINSAMKKEIGKNLLIGSGYRSSAYQVIIFFSSLKFVKFNFRKTVEWAAFPGYSEHGDPRKQAVDFMTENGVPQVNTLLKFEKTKEFVWLNKNANQFGFYLSYPKNNKNGIMYEPWHWRLGK